jgi:hypothetical protein
MAGLAMELGSSGVMTNVGVAILVGKGVRVAVDVAGVTGEAASGLAGEAQAARTRINIAPGKNEGIEGTRMITGW